MSNYIKFVAITEWWVAGVVICLEQGADLHIAQLMPLPLTVSCFSKIQIGFTFLVPAYLRSPGKRAVKQVCVLLQTIYFLIIAAKSEKFHFRFSTVSALHHPNPLLWLCPWNPLGTDCPGNPLGNRPLPAQLLNPTMLLVKAPE